MNDRSFISRFIEAGIVLCLLVILVALIYGHVGGAESGLSLMDSYITEYMKKAPHWPWLIVASFAFALLLFLLALAFLRQGGGRILIVAGCLLLAATAMGNFFVAYAPMRRVEQPPPPAHEWWTPTWWFTSQTSHTPYEHGMADAYADVHYRAIRLVVSMGLTGISFIAAGLFPSSLGRSFAWGTFGAVLAMSVLFLMGDHLEFRRGLWQRLGFVVMYGWLWSAWLHCRRGHKFHAPNGNPW
ncbi:hypothetical protein [Prosthecobacter sp.]|uniref:hypothetical protein n=1 Tax=Prosthecobacter sp. TaxID=1965333 RepID=UPI002ABB2170|nr:hypothetical protein [Prosthecobacter sp.]MDZ4403457.1 hypothetical protein [Prosthecobacter sp.]